MDRKLISSKIVFDANKRILSRAGQVVLEEGHSFLRDVVVVMGDTSQADEHAFPPEVVGNLIGKSPITNV